MAKSMRIAVDARPLATPFNGIGRYTAALLDHMTAMGHEWFLYSSGPIDSSLGELPNVTLRSGLISPKSSAEPNLYTDHL